MREERGASSQTISWIVPSAGHTLGSTADLSERALRSEVLGVNALTQFELLEVYA